MADFIFKRNEQKYLLSPEQADIFLAAMEQYMQPDKKYAGNRGSLRSMTRFGRMHPVMTCTKWQVGCRSGPLLLPTSA